MMTHKTYNRPSDKTSYLYTYIEGRYEVLSEGRRYVALKYVDRRALRRSKQRHIP